jgi:hypothetical protein
MTLARDGAGWRIRGAGHERARLAYATLVDDSVVFTLDLEEREMYGTKNNDPDNRDCRGVYQPDSARDGAVDYGLA